MSVAAEVNDYDGVGAGELRCDDMPYVMGLGKSVDEEYRWSISCFAPV